MVRHSLLLRRRGDAAGANTMLEKALAEAPEASIVHEAIGDANLEQRRFAAAREAFDVARKADPANKSAERKYAECVLQLSAANLPLSSVGELGDYASGKSVLLLSFMIPGLGQVVSGAVGKGAAMLSGVLLSFVWALLVPHGLSELGRSLGRSQGAQLNGFVFVPLALVAAFYLWSLLDAAHIAAGRPSGKPSRPVPPVDKPFEL